MLTRAKSKLIIVGNPETLVKDRMWRKFINYCENNDAFVGRRFKKKSTDKSCSLKKLTERLNVLQLVEEDNE